MTINGLDLFSISHMITLFLTYIYYNHVFDNDFFHFLLLLFIHITWSYCVVRISSSSPFQFDLKDFMYHLCCTMVILLTKCISYVNHLKDFVDPNLRDSNPCTSPNACTSPRVSYVNEMRANASTNDLFKRAQALESNKGPSSSHTHTLEQGGKIKISTFLHL